MAADQILREHLLKLLDGGEAHIHFDALIEEFEPEMINRRINDLPYTAWQILEHLRIAQHDILEFSRNPHHVSPAFPDGYWDKRENADADDWQRTAAAAQSDLQEMKNLIADPSTDLTAQIPHGAGQTILREALLVADHNSYHLGQLALLLRLLQNKS